MSLGPYPEVSLKEAREKREELRKQVAAGTDPGEIRQLTKLALAQRQRKHVRGDRPRVASDALGGVESGVPGDRHASLGG